MTNAQVQMAGTEALGLAVQDGFTAVGNAINTSLEQVGEAEMTNAQVQMAGTEALGTAVQDGLAAVGDWIGNNIVQSEINGAATGENTEQSQVAEIQDSTEQATATNDDVQENTTDSPASEQKPPMDYGAELDRLLAIGDEVEKRFGLNYDANQQTNGISL